MRHPNDPDNLFAWEPLGTHGRVAGVVRVRDKWVIVTDDGVWLWGIEQDGTPVARLLTHLPY